VAIEKLLKLGDPILHKVSEPFTENETELAINTAYDLNAVLKECNLSFGFGRAIAAPQIGVLKRLIFANIFGKELIIINPTLSNFSEETFEVWDDCLSFPNLLVKVMRYKKCTLSYYNEKWQHCSIDLQDSESELLQHEYDHLDGILATQRAIDSFSFKIK
jgi:peptide deformylase